MINKDMSDLTKFMAAPYVCGGLMTKDEVNRVPERESDESREIEARLKRIRERYDGDFGAFFRDAQQSVRKQYQPDEECAIDGLART